MLRKAKRSYFDNIDTKNVTDNRKFWKTIKPIFSKKNVTNESIILVSNNEIISKGLNIVELFNKFFANIVSELNLAIDEDLIENVDHIDDPVLKAIEKFKYHPSILAISEKYDKNTFSFQPVSYEDILKELNNLNISKACQDTDIPTRIVRLNSEIFADFILQNMNYGIASSVYSDNLKDADISPIHKKDSRNIESNYRSVSILSNISKIYERCLYTQIASFFEDKLSRYQCGFRKGFSAQQCLIVMIEN